MNNSSNLREICNTRFQRRLNKTNMKGRPNKTNMQNVREILRLVNEGKLSHRQIAKSFNCSPSTVSAIIERSQKQDLAWPELTQLNDSQLEAKLYPQEINSSKKLLPDYDYVHQELMKKGVTLQLLWQEYYEQHLDGLRYSQFCDHFLKWRELRNISMHQIHRAGEKMFVDWVGLTVPIFDPKNNECREASFFVAALGASNFLYTEPFLSQDIFAWITAHVNALQYFQGVPEIIVPDNLRTGVKKSCFYEPEINPTYLEMATHYGCVIIPARVRKPKDKSIGENGASLVERWIIAKLRHRKFFSLYELKEAVQLLIEETNNQPFQKREGSRRSLFETIEKPALKPLPATAYEYAEFKHARVNIDYHVEFENNFYSAPFQLVRQEVMLKVTFSMVHILHKGQRIASHVRLYGKKYHYSTVHDHMPLKHQKMTEWTPERIVNWANRIGPNTAKVVDHIMAHKLHPEQAYRACLGIIRLEKTYSGQRIENASRRAIAYQAFSYHSMVSILEKNLDLLSFEENPTSPLLQHSNLRGLKYYNPEVK